MKASLIILLGALLVPLLLIMFLSINDKKISDGESAVIDVELLIDRVINLNRTDRPKQALQVLLSALSSSKEDPLLRALLVRAFAVFLEDEITNGQRAIANDHHGADNYFRVSAALELLGEKLPAMEVLLHGISHNPQAPSLWMSIARLEISANRKLEALDVLREVMRLDSSGDYHQAAKMLTADLRGTK